MNKKRTFSRFLLISALSIGAFFLVRSYSNNKKDNDNKIETTELVSEINNRLTYLQLKESVSPVVLDVQFTDQYVLTLKAEYLDKIHYFNTYDYTIETGGSPIEMQSSNICQVIDDLYDRPEPIIDIIKKSDIGINLYGINIELKEIISEILYSIRKALDLKNKSVRVYIKGYADGQLGNWKKKLIDEPYNYTMVDYLPTTDLKSLNPIKYSNLSQYLTIENNSYGNTELPFLRANFIKKDFIEPYLSDCLNKNIEIKILEGYEFKKTKMPLNRKVEIYIQFFEKISIN